MAGVLGVRCGSLEPIHGQIIDPGFADAGQRKRYGHVVVTRSSTIEREFTPIFGDGDAFGQRWACQRVVNQQTIETALDRRRYPNPTMDAHDLAGTDRYRGSND